METKKVNKFGLLFFERVKKQNERFKWFSKIEKNYGKKSNVILSDSKTNALRKKYFI